MNRREGQCQWQLCDEDGSTPMVVEFAGPIFMCEKHAAQVEWITHDMWAAIGFKAPTA